MGSDGISQGIPRGFKGMPEVRQTLAEATINFVKPTGLNLADPDDSGQYADQVWQAGELLQTAMFEPGPDPRKVDTSGVSYAALVSVAEFSASKTSGAERLHQECRRRVL